MSTADDRGLFVEYIAELHRAVHAVGLFLDNRLHGGLSQAEVLVVVHLAAVDSSTINDLHHAFLHRRSTLTSVLDRLQKRHVLRRTTARSDRRSVEIALTSRGRRLAADIAAALDELQRVIEASHMITQRDVDGVRRVAQTASDLSAEST